MSARPAAAVDDEEDPAVKLDFRRVHFCCCCREDEGEAEYSTTGT